MSAPAIGIDLGTTYSCVAVFRNNAVEIIPNAEGNRVTPSYVAFTPTERLVGDAAKNQEALNPTNTVFDAKRLIGRKFDDPIVQADMKNWPFEVINENGKPKIRVQFRGQQKTFFPEEVSSMVLAKMKETAELYLGNVVRDAVITVPAYFNDSQRQATKDAGTIAGLNVLRIINEPTAGALAYGLGDNNDERHVLVYDLGGGTFDVSVLTIEEGIFEVRATTGDTHLGGEDFDNKMVDYFVEEFDRKHQRNLRSDKKAMRRLRTACEKAKRTLSSSKQTTIQLDLLHDGIDLDTTMTRAKFEDLNRELFKSTLEAVKNALDDAKLSKSDIDEVVLVGGSTRIPMIQSLLQEYFNRDLNRSINPDEAVAYGAAVQAAILDGDMSEKVTGLVLVDVTPLSLGTDITGGRMSVIIKRNTTIPTRKTERYYTTKDSQTQVLVQVVEGERAMVADNHLLGEFRLEGIPPMKAGEAKIDVTFEIDANGILHVSAVETSTNREKSITIVNDRTRLTKEEIERLVNEAERFKLDDQKRLEDIEAKNKLQTYCSAVKTRVQDMQSHGEIPVNVGNTVLDRCSDVATWLGSNALRNASEYASRLQQLKKLQVDLHIDLRLRW